MQFCEEKEGQDRSLWLSNIKGPRNIFKINISPAIFSCSATAKAEAVAPAGVMVIMGVRGRHREEGERAKPFVPGLGGTLSFALTMSSSNRELVVFTFKYRLPHILSYHIL